MTNDFTLVVTKRKILWEPAPVVESVSPPPVTLNIDPQPDFIVETDGYKMTLVQTKRAYKHRVGNGHKSVKVRDLYDDERNLIRNDLFIPKNGQISDDDCVAYKNNFPHVWGEIGIFQITGYVSVLHTQVAEGSLMVNNLIDYEFWMRTKYGGTLWARYNLPLYVKTRAINASLISKGQSPVKASFLSKKVKAEKAPDPTTAPVVNTQGEVVGVQGISTTPKFTSFRKKYAGAS